ncbi:extracellular ribonuclease LE [Pelomyxa schiedti]|nr:extracellular ribonuclease LE [Pelomyxa schiedti]
MLRGVLVIALIVATASCCSYSNMSASCKYTTQPEWTWMMFVQSWPGTFCDDGCCRVPATISSIPTGFTIHGLWPNYDGNSYPSCCTCDYTEDEIMNLIDSNPTLRKQLDTYWPAMKNCEFVQYEYEKHGTCAASVYSGTNGPVDYWNVALNLRIKYDLYQILLDAGVKTSTSSNKVKYSLSTVIIPALEKALGYTPFATCDSSDTTQLSDIRICVTRNETEKTDPPLFDCPSTIISSEMNCASSVWIPNFPTMTAKGCPG